jgi:hypothetical protein
MNPYQYDVVIHPAVYGKFATPAEYRVYRNDGTLYATCPYQRFAERVAHAMNALDSNLGKGL